MRYQVTAQKCWTTDKGYRTSTGLPTFWIDALNFSNAAHIACLIVGLSEHEARAKPMLSMGILDEKCEYASFVAEGGCVRVVTSAANGLGWDREVAEGF